MGNRPYVQARSPAAAWELKKQDCYALRALAILTGIRNPGYRPTCSCLLGCKMGNRPYVQAQRSITHLTTLF